MELKINHLTFAEEQLMLTIWNLDQFYLKDLMTALVDPKPHQNTVSTFIKILLEKGFLSVSKQGRINWYKVVIPKESYAMFKLKILVKDFFSNDIQVLYPILMKDEGKLESIDQKKGEKATKKSKEYDVIEDVLNSSKKKKRKKKKKEK